MSRYRGPKLRICRRLGSLPGLSQKSSNKQYPPGEHTNQNKKLSEYGLRLEEKQKLRFNYGINEKQLLRYVRTAKKVSEPTGQVLLQLLEMRLDNTIFRLGMAPTIPSARQIINHKHILINNKIVSICSYQCRPGDRISVNKKKASIQLIQNHLSISKNSTIPTHLDINQKDLQANVKAVVEENNLSLKLNELLIVEYYSKK